MTRVPPDTLWLSGASPDGAWLLVAGESHLDNSGLALVEATNGRVHPIDWLGSAVTWLP